MRIRPLDPILGALEPDIKTKKGKADLRQLFL